jgi:hypothetical protein
LKPKCDRLLSNFALNFNLRRYTKELGVRNKVAGQARAQADAVDKAKQKAQKAQDELKAALTAAAKIEVMASRVQGVGRGLHLFPFQLNLSSSVHRVTQLNS